MSMQIKFPCDFVTFPQVFIYEEARSSNVSFFIEEAMRNMWNSNSYLGLKFQF